ncbi:MAG TPA: hypothetical protein VGD77_00675 [Gemmatimonadaceae bacterium]
MRKIVVMSLATALAACSASSDSTSPGSSGLSQSQAEAFAGQVARALGNGLDNTSFNVGSGQRRFAPPLSSPVAPTLVNVSVQQRTNCTAGGSIQVSGNMSGNISDQGSGALLLQVTETISDWRCIGNLVINGDPYVSAAGTFTFLNGNLNSPATISIGGGFKWGTGSAQSCQMQLTMLVYDNGTGRVSGQVCGRGVNETF